MDDDSPFQSKNNSKMAELFMECEEEELEPWQKKVEEILDEDDDDDELIFVGEISSSKPAISNILNRGNPSSSSKGIKNETVTQGVTDPFKPTSQHYKDPTSNPVAALPRFHPESKSSQNSVIVQNVSKPDFTKNSSQVESDDSSELLFDLTQDTIPLSQEGSTIYIEGINETLPILKRSSASKVNSVTPKKPKTSESVSDISPSASLSLSNSPPVTSSHVMISKGTNTSSAHYKTGTSFLRSCPKCNVKFNLLDPLKYHMKRCCPDMVNKFLEMIKAELAITENKKNGAEKGKLIMLVSDFYYGRHEGAIDDEQKTYTTFKCFSCLKVLKNNIRFMNHMKHHLELEKQNSESWENHTTCQHCYRQYPTPFQLQCHIESTHTPHEFSTICKICELSFETEHALLQHMKDTHKPGEMPYICQVCQFRSSSFSDVESHFRASHENTKNLLCPFCLKVSRMATPYMNHYMKHQKKGVHRCTKCRLQFLTCKEKLDHKTQHRTFIKPKELEGLPPGTKVTIRASIGPLHSKPVTSSPSSSVPSTSSFQLSPAKSKSTTAKNPTKSNASKSKASKPHATKPNASKRGRGASKCKTKTSYKQKKQRNRKNKISIALKNLRCRRGVHKCIECHSKIKDFASHFSIYIHCNFCKYNTNCNKAFINHMVSSHSNHPTKRFYIFKKHSGTLRGITLVCLKCDFLTDSSALDRMAKHLCQRKTHTCQVIIENVPESTSTSEPNSEPNSEPTSECWKRQTEISSLVELTFQWWKTRRKN
ncbi:zinc finger protein 280C isoform X1 [Mustela putorius furo]|uniref:Zinc finger protein 280C isoform X1 n=3 Tax=Mustela putorius furo TaxID=9669 RepID=A0A8U0UR50_MUSPF|nr:zinc finger protein 280C isoform X1 [Mustela putorius furo]XP_044923995.1 zinc finger protein 280C isoform X1 [Mustela putorius furo]XP_044923996.1 zinc finger protein 280C isoform X1 [Mustela putorius furo]